MSKKPPIKKIYLSIFFIIALVFFWMNQGISNEVLEEAFRDTMKTFKINNVTIGELYLPKSRLWAGGAQNVDLYRADIDRYNRVYYNISLHNPSDYALEIRINRFRVSCSSDIGGLSLGEIQNDKLLFIESGESRTLILEGLVFEELCKAYVRSETKENDFGFSTYMVVSSSVSNGRHISYSGGLNSDGTLSTEDLFYHG